MKSVVKVLIGCAGWSYQDWSGVFYPKPLKAGQFLSYYAKFFDYTEVNSTFYNLPSEATIRKWAKRVEFFIVPELNYGQISLQVMRAAAGDSGVVLVPRMGGRLITPQEIYREIRKVSGK